MQANDQTTTETKKMQTTVSTKVSSYKKIKKDLQWMQANDQTKKNCG